MTDVSPALRIAFVSGVTIRKWTTRWDERHVGEPLEILPLGDDGDGVAALHDGSADLCFVRLPVEREGLSVIRLYGEVPVLVVSRDSELADLERIPAGQVQQLDGVVPFPPKGAVKDAVALVAAGVGSLRLPFSLARMHARKDVAAIPIDDEDETEIAVAWLAEQTTEAIEEFVGIVRGRSAASSRGTPTPPKEKPRRVVSTPNRSGHAARRRRKR